MKIQVNQEGVLALKTMSAALFMSTEQILGLTKALRACADSHTDSLGPHKSSLDAVIEDIEAVVKDSSEPVVHISETLQEIADSYQEIIDDDVFAGMGGN